MKTSILLIFFSFFNQAFAETKANLQKCLNDRTVFSAGTKDRLFIIERNKLYKANLLNEEWYSLPLSQFPKEKGMCFHATKLRAPIKNLKSSNEKSQCARVATVSEESSDELIKHEISVLKEYFETKTVTIDPLLKDAKKRTLLQKEIASAQARLSACIDHKPLNDLTASTAKVAQSFASQILKRIESQ